MTFLRRPSTFFRYAVPALLLTLALYVLSEHGGLPLPAVPLSFSSPWAHRHGAGRHPIDDLIAAADKEFAALLSRSTQTLPDAAAAYRRRRGRHPPPGFDKWYEFAKEKNAIIVEDFWDQIYHDLEPFWGVKPAQIRKDAREFEMRIEIRDGKASTGSDWFWTQIWLSMIRTMEDLLPDMDLALNAMDEPRVVAPWEDVQAFMRQARRTRKLAAIKNVMSDFGRLPSPGKAEDQQEGRDARKVEWEREKHYWLVARRGCAPSSAARTTEIITDFDRTPAIRSSFGLEHMYGGYVANYTLSTSFCHQPDLQALEGIFVEPISVSATRSLLPVFGGSKLAVNNDILLPAPMYWNEEDRFTGAEGAHIPWEAKHRGAVWRGVATGGLNRATNWRSFQRHRFVAMNNATLVALAESDPSAHPPPNFALPEKAYRLSATTAHTTSLRQQQGKEQRQGLGAWLTPLVDVAFTDLMCTHKEFQPGCNYTDPYFSTVPAVPMAEQFRHRLLPDVDGNSFSGRYLGFLRSTSLPIKATLWREWHDARLVAWKHFVPMDSRFGDWYGILEYFLGNEAAGVTGRDEAARRIALEGREWAGKVLRREDMQVYVLRLLLEYARVADDKRERMGWVGDLREGG